MNPQKLRQLIISILLGFGIPLSILTAQFAGATLPFIPAAIIGGAVCGITGFYLLMSIWSLISHR